MQLIYFMNIITLIYNAYFNMYVIIYAISCQQKSAHQPSVFVPGTVPGTGYVT